MIRTLAAVGELRVSQLAKLDPYRSSLDILTSAPGFRPLPDIASRLYATPHAVLSARLGRALCDHLMVELQRDIDTLTPGPEWGERLSGWARSLRRGDCRVRFFESRLLYTRLLSEQNRSLVFSHPLDTEPDSEIELRLAVQEHEHQRVRAWFNERFDSAIDISERIAKSIDESWAGCLITPRDAYRKVLIDYFDDVLLSLDRDCDANPMLERLTEFQVDAYHYAKFILRRYGGVFLADVVGLGKTFIAVALLKHLQDSYGHHAVVVAPPKVLPAWQALAEEQRVEMVFVSMGKLSDLEKYQDREVLVVDESHNFRNGGTRRFEELTQWVRPPGQAATRKVLLLSATPQNNSIEDIRHQLQLFPDSYSALPLKAESLGDWCRQVRTGERTATELLQHVVVRRTRRYVREAFPNATIETQDEAGNRVRSVLRFPKRISGPDQCLRYSLTDTYHGKLYESILRALASLSYPLHSLGEYLSEAGRVHERTQGFRRAGTSVRGLFKVLLLKRLESSVLAFRKSAERLEVRLAAMLVSIDEGSIPTPGEMDPGEDDDALGASERALALELFEVDRLKRAVREDLNEIRAILALVSDLNHRSDAKIARLTAYLAQRPPAEHKTIIFTQFTDTAGYIVSALREQNLRPEVVTGSSGNALRLARRFSPKSNRYHFAEGESEIELLVSTDVLSEGVNLQDADTLINYDLHWNPVRLIQRAGRVDRIGSEHDAIEVASFLPEQELEADLGLEEVLRRRIREFISVFGEDSDVLPAEAAPQESEMVRAYSGRALTAEDNEDDDLDGLSRHQERLLRFRKDEPDEYVRLRELRSGRFSSDANASSVAASRVGNFWYFWGWSGGRVRQLNARGALDAFHDNASLVGDETPDPEAWAILGQIQTVFLDQARTLRAQQEAPRMSPSLLKLLESLEKLLIAGLGHEHPVILETIEWARARAGHPTLEKRAQQLRRDKAAPRECLLQCRRLIGTVAAPGDELGEPRLVAASLASLAAS